MPGAVVEQRCSQGLSPTTRRRNGRALLTQTSHVPDYEPVGAHYCTDGCDERWPWPCKGGEDFWAISWPLTFTHTTSSYSYQPLAEGWIRVLKLQPGHGPLFCKLHHQRLDDPDHPFEALSYVWGEQEPKRHVLVDSMRQVLPVGPNLANALRRLRLPDRERAIWADAICINQTNSTEKGVQVSRMGEVYANAWQVVVWLGEDVNGIAKDAFELVERTTATLDKMIEQYGALEDVPLLPSKNPPIASGQEAWVAVYQLMNNIYFSRIWALAETGLAQTAIIQWGRETVDWSCLVELLLIINNRPDVKTHTGGLWSGNLSDTFYRVWRHYQNVHSWKNDHPVTRKLAYIDHKYKHAHTFLHVLTTGRRFNATDSRDHVYAFLSHPAARSAARSVPMKLLAPDYNADVDQVYLDTAMFLMETDPSPWRVLVCVGHAPGSPALGAQRPSWVPYWNEGWRTSRFDHVSWYRAGGHDISCFTYLYEPADKTIHLTGAIFDNVTWSSRPFTLTELMLEEQIKNQPLQELWSQLKEQEDMLPSIYDTKAQQRHHAFALSVIVSRDLLDGETEIDHLEYRALWLAYERFLECERVDIDDELKNKMRLLVGGQRRAMHNRKFFRTNQGYYGVAFGAMEIGDVCCVFKGANVPFILRKCDIDNRDNSARYWLVGAAYIHGIMHGELWESEEPIQEKIVLV